MGATLAELSDRLEIQDLLIAYSHAIDDRSWDALDALFTTDAVIDYTETGGTRGGLPETKLFLSTAMEAFVSFQHLVATSKVTLTGDSAAAKTICHNPLVMQDADGSSKALISGFWYHDVLIRTPDGWRISHRRQERAFLLSVPAE